MKPSLQVRLSQHLALTPQLQQSIRLLQLSTLELHQEVGQMLEQNPFLEMEEDTAVNPYETPSERQAADRVADTAGDSTATTDAPESAESTPEITADDFGTTERDDWENGTERDDFDGIRETPSNAAPASDDDFEPERGDASGPSLQEHLRLQLMALRLSEVDRLAVWVLIESLNDDGYLADPLEEIAPQLASLLEAQGAEEDEISEEAVADTLHCALKWLQSMEPVGVGARNLGECLALQLHQGADCPARHAALAICDRHLELLAKRDHKRIAAATGADEETVKAASALIVACDPKPGRPFTRSQGQVVVPDVIVLRSGRNLKVALNPDVMPKLRINDLYAQAVRNQRGGSTSPMGARLQEARWFMKNIQQRFDTILRVAKAIVERQKTFFIHGEIAMKPLVLREIADELGLHESTISRVTTQKYLGSPIGTFELKYFFGSSLNTDAGGNASSTAVRALIKQFVAAEDADKPLSDSQLSQMLEEQGIQVARRTVAKYREALKIAPANLRRNP